MKEGGEQQASCLVAKQAVEFPQVYTSVYNNACDVDVMNAKQSYCRMRII